MTYSEQTASLIAKLRILSELIASIISERPKLFNGERYISGKDLANHLHISMRTLQEYRLNGLLGYVRICGKILYRESDVQKLLEDHFFDSWDR